MGFFIYLCTMKKLKGETWSNVSRKPKGFAFVKGRPMTYTYEVPVIYVDDTFKNHDFDRVFIKVKMKHDKEYDRIEFDMDATKKMVAREIGTYKSQYDDGLFKRDGILFPFISQLRIFGDAIKKEYLGHKFLKVRKAKLIKLKKNINQ